MIASGLSLPIALEDFRTILKKHGVVSASLFGSFARGEATPDSDIDLLVTLSQSSSLFDLVDLQLDLETATKRKVDVATKLHPRFEPYINPELVTIL